MFRRTRSVGTGRNAAADEARCDATAANYDDRRPTAIRDGYGVCAGEEGHVATPRRPGVEERRCRVLVGTEAVDRKPLESWQWFTDRIL